MEKSALIAMNDKDFQSIMVEMLPLKGYANVDAANDMDDLLKKIKNKQYHAIIMDINFPKPNTPIDNGRKVHELIKDRIGIRPYDIIFIGFTGNVDLAAEARKEKIPTIAKPDSPLKYLDVQQYGKLLAEIGR